MKKSTALNLSILILIIIVVMVSFKTVVLYYEKKHQEEALKNATIIVNLKEDLDVEFDTICHISDFIEYINGNIVEDSLIETNKLGKKEIKFEFVNEENIKVPYSFNLNIVDKTAPLVMLGDSYSINTNFKGNLEEKIMCIDNHDDEPNCQIEGEYDTQKVGSYNLTFIGEDSSGNRTVKPFTLRVLKPSSSGSTYNPNKYYFSDAKDKYESFTASVGIDVSSWQGNIDFDKVKESGVEFAFVRVGSKWGSDGDYFLDSKFEQNMEGFNRVGIPVGVYFYSYAKNEIEAEEEARWVLDKIKPYKVDLPIAFDFEDWSNINSYKMSIYRLNNNANTFIETVEKEGYEGMLYSSLNYMNRIWKNEYKNIWVAHYTNNADYEGIYNFWQFTSAGAVDGINGYVDLNVMYKR